MAMKTIPSPSSICTVSGYYFDFNNPEASRFTIEDIAHALSMLCRFTGHCKQFYSVAQHSVLVSMAVPREDALAGLLHDAAEAFLGDVSSPLKRQLPDYRKLEARVENALLARFGITHIPPSVKHADLVLLRTEQRDLMNADNQDWGFTAGVQPLGFTINPVSAGQARLGFLSQYYELKQEGL